MASYYQMSDCQLDDLDALASQELDLPDKTYAVGVEKNIPLYDGPTVTDILANPDTRHSLLSEWAEMLVRQSGVIVIKQAITEHDVIDDVTQIYNDIIEAERGTQTGGDHFAGKGANDRVWNSLQKLCLADPALFIRYFGSPSIDGVCEAYLGPAYQMTAQVNLVRPTGRAQTAHRDYHLGFMPAEQALMYPVHTHDISTTITLQGAIAHCDMPAISGPTKLLPFSQLLKTGYIAVHQQAYRDYFEAHYVQVPLSKGDAVFFSPAVFHAAGDNDSTDIARMANLLQISSMMGRPIESVDRETMVKALFPAFQQMNVPLHHRNAAIHASAEGYAFPTNLDADPPLGGNASETQAELLKRALDEGMSQSDFEAALVAQSAKKRA